MNQESPTVRTDEAEHALSIRHILVALDASPHSWAALRAAVELAARFGAEVQGLFVEDVDLLRVTELPFVCEVRVYSATARHLNFEELEQRLRAQAGEMRRALQAAAKQTQTRWAFRVVRGAITPELLAAAVEADLVIVGKSGWSPVAQQRLGSIAQALFFGASCSTLILQQNSRLRFPLWVIYDGSPLADDALATALALTPEDEETLTVLILAAGPATARRLQARVAARLEARSLTVHFHTLDSSHLQEVASLARLERCGTLIVPASETLLEGSTLLTLLEELETPVLLVR